MPTPRSRLGTWGEGLATKFLEGKGYRILDTNYRCARGEIDVVARDGEDLVFVEVRTGRSGSFVAPEETLSKAKIRRLLATCEDYLHKSKEGYASWRIDLVCVYLGDRRELQRIQHLRHAVQL